MMRSGSESSRPSRQSSSGETGNKECENRSFSRLSLGPKKGAPAVSHLQSVLLVSYT